MVICYLLFLFCFPPCLVLISSNKQERAVGGNGRWEGKGLNNKHKLEPLAKEECAERCAPESGFQLWHVSHMVQKSSLSFCYFALFIVFMVVGLLTMSYGAFLPRLIIIKRNLNIGPLEKEECAARCHPESGLQLWHVYFQDLFIHPGMR